MKSKIQDILAPLLDDLTPKTYSSTCDHLLSGHLSMGIDIDELSTKGGRYTFTSTGFDISQQTHTQNLHYSVQLKDYIEPIPFDEDQQLADTLLESMFSSHKKQLSSDPSLLKQMERVVVSIVENNQITIGNFSENSLTNANKYNHLGEVEAIEYVQVPIENKRYTSEDVYNKMPHPVRMKKRKRIVKEEIIEPKSKQEILQQFDILADMFKMDVNDEEEDSYQKALDVIAFQDTSYDVLWQEILDKIQFNDRKEQKTIKKKDDGKGVADDQFRRTVDRVIKDHEQYEKQIQDDLVVEKIEDEQEDQTTTKELTEDQKQEQQPTQTFKSIKISNVPTDNLNRQRYPFAIEDESDLTNFYDILPKQKFAMQYNFELDQFQKRSILHLERKQSVFVCAHTSAGKTVVAEYGIALAIKHKRKVIYTSPIKALSNQKYREFCQKFDSVGIVTGDISMNQEANCVIMTTQILANQLYKGADMIRDIQWVIFDEVHYINNPQRGVVWEETIIMLPEHIGIIMLSATVPNYLQFANWVGRTKRRTVFVMKTFHRPVPLEHSLYIFDKFHVIKEANGNFLVDQYKDMLKQIHRLNMTQQQIKEQKKADKKKKIQERGFWNDNRREQGLKRATQNAVNKFIKNVSQDDMKRHKDRQESRMISKLIADCKQKKLLPCVIFCFSKRKIHEIAQNIYTTQLTTNQEAGEVLHFFKQAMHNLKPEDKDLNQFRFLFEIARNGYAIHHGDLMPLAKQIVELLFSKGLIKVLLATETFAMGINMPTKTVIFHSTRKVDGPQGKTRFLNSSEYVQMSGRAGRRGLDQKGTVIIIVKDPDSLPKPDEMIRMTDSPGQALVSKFRVTYKTILNLYSSKQINAQQMMRQSFYENPKFSSLSTNHDQIRSLKREYDSLSEFQCPYNQLQTRLLIQEYMKSVDNNRDLNEIQFSYIQPNKIGLPKFGEVLDHSDQFHKCIVLKIDKERQATGRTIQILTVNQINTEFHITRKELDESEQPKKKKIVLEYENAKTDKIETGAIPDTKNKFHYYVRWIKPSELVDIYSLKVTNEKNIVYSKEVYQDLGRKLMNTPEKLVSFFREEEYTQEKKRELQTMIESKCHNCQFKAKHLQQNSRRRKIKVQLLNLMSKVDRSELALLGNYQEMIRTLQDLQFVSKGSILLKGKIARQVDIYVTQILVEGVLQPLKQQQIAALLSAFVNQFKPRVKPKEGQENDPNSPFHPKDTYTPALAAAIDKTYEIVKRIIEIEFKHNWLTDYSQQQRVLSIINFYLSKPIYQWTIGIDFIDIADPQQVPEGTLIRTIMRLDILLRNLKSGCMIVGNTSLAEKVQRASEMIKRDIVFTQSLYLAD